MSAIDAPLSQRLFIGLMAPHAVRESVAAWRSAWQWPRGAAMAAPTHWHVTLHFLGDTRVERVPSLIECLSRTRFKPFELRLGRPEFWQRGLVVIRPEPSPALVALHSQVHAQVQVALGERPVDILSWKPHLTVARKAAGAVAPTQGQALDLSWSVNAFSLVWSRLPPSVPVARYETLATFEARN